MSPTPPRAPQLKSAQSTRFGTDILRQEGIGSRTFVKQHRNLCHTRCDPMEPVVLVVRKKCRLDTGAPRTPVDAKLHNKHTYQTDARRGNPRDMNPDQL